MSASEGNVFRRRWMVASDWSIVLCHRLGVSLCWLRVRVGPFSTTIQNGKATDIVEDPSPPLVASFRNYELYISLANLWPLPRSGVMSSLGNNEKVSLLSIWTWRPLSITCVSFYSPLPIDVVSVHFVGYLFKLNLCLSKCVYIFTLLSVVRHDHLTLVLLFLLLRTQMFSLSDSIWYRWFQCFERRRQWPWARTFHSLVQMQWYKKNDPGMEEEQG